MARSPTRSVRPEAAPFHAPQGVHLALAVGLPAVFCGLCAYWLGGTGPTWPEGINLVYAVLVSLWSSWRLRTKQGPWLRLWLWIALSLCCFAAQGLLEGLPWPRTFAFEGTHLVWFLLGLFQAQLGALWAGQLASRARLFQLTAGVPDGKDLEQLVREYQLDADFSRSNRTVLTLSLALLMIVAAVLVSVTRYGHGGLSESLFVAFFLLCLLAGVLVRTYRREMESMMYGRRWTWGEKTAPLGWSLLLVLVASGVSYALLVFGPWSTGFQFPRGDGGTDDISTNETPQSVPASKRDIWVAVLAAVLGRILGVDNLLLAAVLVVRTVAFVAPWAVLAVLVWPLLRWIASGGRETRGLLKRWRELIAAQWAAFLTALRAWWGRPRVEPARPLGSLATQRWLRSFFKTAGPKPLLPEMVEAFLRVVAWAEPVAAYRLGETTREFLDRVAGSLPRSAGDLAWVRDALDRELFGQGLDDRSEFLARVRSLISRPPFHETPPEVS